MNGMLADPARPGRAVPVGDERRQEVDRASLHPRADVPGPSPLDEPGVTATRYELGSNRRRQQDRVRKRFPGNDRIVEGVDEQGRQADA